MEVRNIAKAILPQADGGRKIRPVLLLKQMPPFQDWLVCGISTQLRLQVENFDEVISDTEADFVDSGLIASSVIRLVFLAVLPKETIQGVIGSISQERYDRLIQNLIKHLESN